MQATRPSTVPRTLQHLMADAGIFSKRVLANRAQLQPAQISYLCAGWRGNPKVLRRVAQVLGVSQADVLAAARAAHETGAP